MDELEKKIAWIKAEIRKTPYNKDTEHYIGLLRAKLARLSLQLEEKKTKRVGVRGFAIPKEGDATCVLVGFPSVGKSTILSKLTAAKPKIAPYPFTTLSVIPGILNYKGASIQILDVPGLVGGAAIGRGGGGEILSIARIANLLIIVAEATNFSDQKENALEELYQAGIRVNRKKPEVKVKRLGSGGIKIISVPDLSFTTKQIILTAKELGLSNAEIQIKEQIILEDLIDTILSNRVYLPAIFVASKADLVNFQPQNNVIQVSAVENFGFESLKEKIWQKLGLIRVYLKPVDSTANFGRPLILKYGTNIITAAEKISTGLGKNLRFALVIRGKNKKQVGPNFELKDEDIVTFLSK